MPVDSEEIRMLAQCRILERRMTGPERALVSRLERSPAHDSPTEYFDFQDGEDLRFAWERITDFGRDEAEARRGP